jgi:hypothetical protein
LNFDGFVLDISRDGGTTWTTVNGISGSTGGMFINLPFSEIPDGSASTQFRFNFISDSSIVEDGGYFDNLGVECTYGTPSGTTDYQFLAGTSMATPHVTGVVGLVLAANPHLNVSQIRNAILNTTFPVPALNGVISTGRRLNAFHAVSSVMATFTIPVTRNGTGTGTVTSNPSTINCGPTCNASFNPGTTVTLMAIPDAGSVFSGWSGDACIGTATCVVNSAATVMATFDIAPTASGDGGGGGCTIARAGTSDALMPTLLVLTLCALIWQVIRRSN